MLRYITALIAAALLCSSAMAEVKTITIVPADEYEDGTPLPANQIASHLVECSRDGGQFSLLEDLAMPTLSKQYDFAPGEWVCRAWTKATNGKASAVATLSDPFVVEPPAPKAPKSIGIS